MLGGRYHHDGPTSQMRSLKIRRAEQLSKVSHLRQPEPGQFSRGSLSKFLLVPAGLGFGGSKQGCLSGPLSPCQVTAWGRGHPKWLLSGLRWPVRRQLSRQWQLGHCAHRVGILPQEAGCFFFQGQRSELPTSLPHPHVTSSLLFTAYSQPDWVKIKRLYLFPCGGRQ